ncbi:Lrp/AsnC family transcriptional regulator [Amycolatopsis sp. NPDC047767]|uniref:Lrp/AsnC family transcriptional regulator n=1 Tax=Amycolatopsis sp. NPDC047767 TaxID=3156765 RepID=UPI00345261F3
MSAEGGSEITGCVGYSPSFPWHLPDLAEFCTITPVDAIDRSLVRLLEEDGRRTYNELSAQVRLSANTVADRVRRLRAAGVIRGFRADLDPAALGRGLTMVSDVRLREDVDRTHFERELHRVPQVVSGARMTGEYDYQLRLACLDPAEFETVVDRLKREHGVRELRSRLVLHELDVSATGLLDLA